MGDGLSQAHPAVLRAHGLCKRFGELIILNNFDLHVDAGEFVSVIGPSGSGKSTLLNCLGGLMPPDSGTVQVAGQTITGLTEPRLTKERRRLIGYVFQWHGLLHDLTARQNVAIAAWAADSTRSEAFRRAGRLLAELGLQDRADQLAQDLSGGEAQRVGVARALINDPAVILADEPTASLDGQTKGAVVELLGAATTRGCAVVLATHDQAITTRSDRIIALA